MNGTFHHFVKEMVDLVPYWVVSGEFFCVNKFRFHSVFRPPLEAPLSTDTASLSKIALYRIFSCQQSHRTADPLRVIFLMMTIKNPSKIALKVYLCHRLNLFLI